MRRLEYYSRSCDETMWSRAQSVNPTSHRIPHPPSPPPRPPLRDVLTMAFSSRGVTHPWGHPEKMPGRCDSGRKMQRGRRRRRSVGFNSCRKMKRCRKMPGVSLVTSASKGVDAARRLVEFARPRTAGGGGGLAGNLWRLGYELRRSSRGARFEIGFK